MSKREHAKISTTCDATRVTSGGTGSGGTPSGGTPVNDISESVTIYVRVSTYRVTLLFPLFYR